MITLSGTFVVRRTCCSHEACESCDQTRGQSIFGLPGQAENALIENQGSVR
jgi:hypothetical protein